MHTPKNDEPVLIGDEYPEAYPNQRFVESAQAALDKTLTELPEFADLSENPEELTKVANATYAAFPVIQMAQNALKAVEAAQTPESKRGISDEPLKDKLKLKESLKQAVAIVAALTTKLNAKTQINNKRPQEASPYTGTIFYVNPENPTEYSISSLKLAPYFNQVDFLEQLATYRKSDEYRQYVVPNQNLNRAVTTYASEAARTLLTGHSQTLGIISVDEIQAKLDAIMALIPQDGEIPSDPAIYEKMEQGIARLGETIQKVQFALRTLNAAENAVRDSITGGSDMINALNLIEAKKKKLEGFEQFLVQTSKLLTKLEARKQVKAIAEGRNTRGYIGYITFKQGNTLSNISIPTTKERPTIQEMIEEIERQFSSTKGKPLAREVGEVSGEAYEFCEKHFNERAFQEMLKNVTIYMAELQKIAAEQTSVA
ncbi:MAG: hypothetical protein UT33_C0011G0196 [Candidatus Peregrinibacteria bacterium GW2011_GWC2_39_14]|nr:MAG: hypothetical protein UT33_C0011G0196 [Candidatus Peregrinibacteria bacterium GW2011_GWC2_39_14]